MCYFGKPTADLGSLQRTWEAYSGLGKPTAVIDICNSSFEAKLNIIEYHVANNSSIFFYKNKYVRSFTQDSIKLFNNVPKYYAIWDTGIPNIQGKLDTLYRHLLTISEVTFEICKHKGYNDLISASKDVIAICQLIKANGFEHILQQIGEIVEYDKKIENTILTELASYNLPPFIPSEQNSATLNTILETIRRQDLNILSFYLVNEEFRSLAFGQYNKFQDLYREILRSYK